MKIAVMGSASSSVGKAPFKNDIYRQWVEGKVESIARAHDSVAGNWDIWACSPGCWAVIPRATRFFEVHRWELDVQWFSPEYRQFLRAFKGIVYTGGAVPEIPNHVIYPIDRIEEKFSSYNLTSSLALMLALAIETIEDIRAKRKIVLDMKASGQVQAGGNFKSLGVADEELEKSDTDDVIGLWGVDMAAHDEYAYQRPGCQNLVLEAMRRDIGVYLPAESDLMRPMPVYGISEWDHNYIKLTSRAKELSVNAQAAQTQIEDAKTRLLGLQGEQHALNYFVSTWTSPYGMLPGMIIRQAPGTGMGSGITQFDGRPVSRMVIAPPSPPASSIEIGIAEAREVKAAMAADPDLQLGRELVGILQKHCGERGDSEGAVETLNRIIAERASAHAHAMSAPGAAKKRRR